MLGGLAAADEEQLELRLLADDAYAKELEVVEDELMDQYVAGALTAEERQQVERHFLKSPERQSDFRFAVALTRHASERAAVKDTESAAPPPRARAAFASSVYFRIAAILVVVAGLGFTLWQAYFRATDIDRGVLALREAYRNERLTEARITGFDHAPLVILRGQEAERINYASRDRAERLLLDALAARPTAEAHHALGAFYLSGRQLDKAVDQFKLGLIQSPDSARLHSDMGAALLELGTSGRSNEPAKSLEHFAKSLEHLNRALEIDGSLLEASYNRALLYQRMMLPQQALDEWKKYLEKDSGSRWADEARSNLKLLGEQGRKSSQKKEQLFEEFARAYQTRDIGRAWASLSQSRSRTGNSIVERLLDEHLDSVKRKQDGEAADKLRMLVFAAETEEQTVGDRFTSDLANFYRAATADQRATAVRARGLMRTAQERYNQSELEAAASLYEEAGQMFDRAGNAGEALFAEGWAGYCYLRIPDSARSVRTFERLSEAYEKRKYKSLLAQSLHAMSDAQTSIDELSKALDYAGRSLAVSEQIQDTANQSRCLQQFASMNLKFGDYRRSLGFGVRGIDLALTLPPDPKLLWPLYHEVAFDFYWLGLHAAALEFEKEALRLALESKWPPIISRSHMRLGLIYEKLGDLSGAIESGRRARREGENVVSELSRLNILANSALRLGHLFRRAGDPKAALSNYDEAISRYEKLSLHIYLYEAHKGKFQAHLDLNDDATAAGELKTALRLFEQYRSKIVEERNRNNFFDVGQDIYDQAIDFTYTRMNDPLQALDYSEASHARSLLDAMNAPDQLTGAHAEPDIKHTLVSQPLKFAEVQKSLPEQVQLIQYAMLDRRLLIWVVTGTSVEAREYPITADALNRKALDYLQLITKISGREQAASSAAKELYGILIGTVEPLLNAEKQLAIVPDKVLNKIPFGALTSPDSGRFFIEKYRFVLSPSANVFVRCSERARQKAQPARERMLSVGDPGFDPRQFPALPDLPSARREAQEVAACYAGQALVGERAREGKVRAEMPGADVIHLASHFVVDEHSSMLSKLLLAGEGRHAPRDHTSDGTLQASEVYGMKLPRTRLVVLSACQTGVEHAYRGEGA
ncbi:MAG TPA: CHAT domain-containing protein, partial [Pyrinomonadaceae bacterium]|nr:CHAT domain-containing protein [Pyrinomonadaceae bacterium]